MGKEDLLPPCFGKLEGKMSDDCDCEECMLTLQCVDAILNPKEKSGVGY